MRFNAPYRSEVEVEFNVEPNISGLGPNYQALLNLTWRF